MIRTALLIFTLIFSTVPANAQAFGIAMGTPETSLSVNMLSSIGQERGWVGIDPPQPNGAFGFYYAYVAPLAGVCAIEAESYMTEPAVTAETIASLIPLLTERYGPPIQPAGSTRFEFRQPGGDLSYVTLLKERDRVILRYGFANLADCRSELAVDPAVGL